MDRTLIENGQYNIGHICTGLQCARGLSGRTALRWLPARGPRRDYTFCDLDRASGRFANLLVSLGLGPGDVFFTFLPKMPEQFIAMLGALKARVICGALFASFGEEALIDRLADSGASAVLTSRALLPKIARIRGSLPALKHIIPLDGDDPAGSASLMAGGPWEFRTETTPPDAPALLHYTSGSTGRPKGVLHSHGSVEGQAATARDILGLGPDDIYWCTADQGWITGTAYGMTGPWSLGVTQIHHGGGYDAARWTEILTAQGTTVWYSSPTAFRMLMREEPAMFSAVRDSPLRHIFSVGEPLGREVIDWGRRVIGRDIHDTWFQTETGAIMIANRPGPGIRPGSMGKTVPGVEAAVLGGDGRELPAGSKGDLCLKPGWPAMFTSYVNNEAAFADRFRGGWYRTGDIASRDADGYFWFHGRGDEVINTAGHLISPFEVESSLLGMPEVADCGVTGAPDELFGERVVAFVRLRPGVEPSAGLELKLRLHVSHKASTIATPQAIVFCGDIPRNKSGKIMRRLLKARYTGADAGDLSTLEGTA